MNTTIKQQVAAVRRALNSKRKTVKNAKNYPHNTRTNRLIRTAELDVERLNDAASTLAAVGMIGEDKIKALPEMFKLLRRYKDTVIDERSNEYSNRLKDVKELEVKINNLLDQFNENTLVTTLKK